MLTRLISPEELAPGAVVPQCLDVHYVSDAVMNIILREGRDYKDPVIASMRQKETFIEYRRSLLFSRQTIINRAFFTNPMIHADFAEGYDNEVGRKAFGVLLQSGAVVPYLLRAADFLEDLAGVVGLDEAEPVVHTLDSIVEELQCVRLAIDDEENREAAARVDQAFRAFVAALYEVPRAGSALNSLAADVYNNQPLSDNELRGFGRALAAVSDFARTTEVVNRTVLYEQFLTNGPHRYGRFKSLSENPFMLAQKKVLDLRYNTALADHLQRFTLTPAGLPTHAAVDYVVPSGPLRRRSADDFLADVTDRRLVGMFSSVSEAFYLPHLHELTIADIAYLRATPEWQLFAEAQDKLLSHAESPSEFVPLVSQRLHEFQRAFSRWYYASHPNAKPLVRYKSVVSVVIQILGVTLAVLFSDAATVERIVIGTAPLVIPEKVKGLVAREMVHFVDPERYVVNRDYSYSVDLLRSGIELSKQDVVDLFSQFGVRLADQANTGGPS